ncbi:phd finger and bah domain protein [Phlyctema vagabunda]|uniref:Phd finger and bah domain protein n=1 Tax=Phlyctema vagabunda TaxID=108571 RepID=A0ABR4P1Q5_9HELO
MTKEAHGPSLAPEPPQHSGEPTSKHPSVRVLDPVTTTTTTTTSSSSSSSSSNKTDPNTIPSSTALDSDPSTTPDTPPTTVTTAQCGGEVQSMATSPPTTSRSSREPDNPTAGAGTASGIPYGTRSRNRTGASRPNYAEDKELELDFEGAATTKEKNGRKAAEPASVTTTTTEPGRPANNTRKAAAVAASEQDLSVTMRSHSKEPIPGTSTFSAKPTAPGGAIPTSKKRKAGGQPATHAVQASSQPAPQVIMASPANRQSSNAPTICLGFRETNMLSFDNGGARLRNKKLVADDGTVLEVNDHVYLVCEPPGEPYYLGRIMEFLHVQNDATQPIEALRLNWYYRPKDIGRKVNDTRQVFASMHSDISPLTALRGKCQIKHRSEVEKLDELRKMKDWFWYEKLYDRYIHRYYEVIPTRQVINVPEEVKRVLDDRWKYILVESGRGKELTSAVKSCKRCTRYCASNDSVDCAVCRNTYHMSCVNPPLLKKPSRGFAWACGPCSKAQEKKLEARNTPNMNTLSNDAEDDDANDDDDDLQDAPTGDSVGTGRTTPTKASDTEYPVIHPGTAEQIHQASLWPFRYLGIHCRVEDALDYDDRIYPRASSRLGPRHQANVPAWPGRPVEYVKTVEIKRKYVKGGSQKKGSKLTEETIAALEAEKLAREARPKWVMDEPPGYIRRGEDYDDEDLNNTAQLLYKLPETSTSSDGTASDDMIVDNEAAPSGNTPLENVIDDYMLQAKKLAKPLGLPELSTNLLDVALETLFSHDFDAQKALASLSSTDKKVFKEPDLSPSELKKFEDGVSKYGSEWHSIKKHVKSVSAANIVRFYYTWKKTDRGKHVWGNYSGRKGKKEAKKAEVNTGKLQDDVADDHDDSAFDNDKAFAKKRGFECKFCATRTSRQWRRAPNTPAGTTVMENPNSKPTAKDKGSQLMVALCRRCAELWRRYAIQWEDIDEVAKKVAQGGSRAWKRRIDEEVMKELVTANEVTNQPPTIQQPPPVEAPPMIVYANPPPGPEPPKKKMKAAAVAALVPEVPEHTIVEFVATPNPPGPKKKAPVEKVIVAPPPPPPEPPKPKLLPCSICAQMDPMEQYLCCKDCRLAVHRTCYGALEEARSDGRWVCPMCSNDKNPQVSIQYKCMLCPVEFTAHDFAEPQRAINKKKSEKDRGRDREERESAIKNAEFFKKKQEEANKPSNPREPLKRTANNNWVHVTCAVFTPEVKFGNAKALEPSEGIPSIPSARAPVHVECANQAEFVLGFDIAPVKSSRRDQVNIVSMNGEVGTMTAAIWCKEHVPTKTIVYRIHDVDTDTGLTALQLYSQNFKQADLALTGTVRKATLINQSTKAINPSANPVASNRRTSTTNGIHVGRRGSTSHVKEEEASGGVSPAVSIQPKKKCATCDVDVTPKWHTYALVPTGSATPQVRVDAASPSVNLTIQPRDQQRTNGTVDVDENNGNVALAVAALGRDVQTASPQPLEYQCHKCHIKKVRREPTPKVEAPSPAVQQETLPAPAPTIQPIPAPLPSITPEVSQPVQQQYNWPQPPVYPSNSPYNDWSRPVTTSHSISSVHQLNGHHSPRAPIVSAHTLNSQTQMRQAPVAHSPLQNGHMHSTTNGYPSSPHRNLGGPTGHLQQNGGGFPSYAATRPGYQHLTNGGPPPRAPEHPFTQPSAPVHSRTSFGSARESPSMHREPPVPNRDLNNTHNGNMRPHDGRVNGGASASPSLRNLLS